MNMLYLLFVTVVSACCFKAHFSEVLVCNWLIPGKIRMLHTYAYFHSMVKTLFQIGGTLLVFKRGGFCGQELDLLVP